MLVCDTIADLILSTVIECGYILKDDRIKSKDDTYISRTQIYNHKKGFTGPVGVLEKYHDTPREFSFRMTTYEQYTCVNKYHRIELENGYIAYSINSDHAGSSGILAL